jgi:hypothetical protein
LVLYSKGKPGGLIVAHQDDIAAVAAELARHGRADEPARTEPAGPGRTEGPERPRLASKQEDGYNA